MQGMAENVQVRFYAKDSTIAGAPVSGLSTRRLEQRQEQQLKETVMLHSYAQQKVGVAACSWVKPASLHCRRAARRRQVVLYQEARQPVATTVAAGWPPEQHPSFNYGIIIHPNPAFHPCSGQFWIHFECCRQVL